MNIIEFLGWFGTCLYLLNHAYLSLYAKWRPPVYYWGNFLAAAALIVSSFVISSWQAVAINGFWAVISLLMIAGVSLRALPFTSYRLWLMIGVVAAIGTFALWRSPEKVWSIISWLAAITFGLSYLLFCAERLAPRHYQVANVVAALGCMPQLWIDLNYAVFFLEFAWALISARAVYKRYKEMHLID